MPNPTDLNRRGFIKGGLQLISSMCLGQGGLLEGISAQEVGTRSPHFFVLYIVRGGWDVTLSLDPWYRLERPDEKDIFIEYRSDEVSKSEGLYLGPAAKSMLKHAKDMAVINGIIISEQDQGHEASHLYMISGDRQGKSPGLTTQLALSGHRGPYGVISDQGPIVKNLDINFYSFDSIERQQEFLVPAGKIPHWPKQAGFSSPLLLAEKGLKDSQSYIQKICKHLYRFRLKYPQLGHEHYLAACFLPQASYHGEVLSKEFLDSHSNHVGAHFKQQQEIWERISSFFDFFKSIPFGHEGKSLFEHTTFIVLSEFSRMPWLNVANGKDHNPLTNSVLLAGKGIRGGRSLGESTLIGRKLSKGQQSYSIGLPIDFQSGNVVKHPSLAQDAGFIFPENIIRTLAQLMKVDMGSFTHIPSSTRPLPFVLKDT